MMTSDHDVNTTGLNPLATALLGAAAGAFGVWALDRLDWAMWDRESAESRAQTTAVRPGGEPPAQALVTKVEQASGVATTPGTHEALGQIVHYTIGVAPAIGYALLRDKLPGRGATRGALYGLGLFVVEDELLNPLTGLAAKPGAYPWQAHARGFFAHLLYGLATEFALNAAELGIARSRRVPNDGRSNY
jgi:hypothetical protein